MIQICQKDKEKVFEAIRTGKIDVAEMSFPNRIADILLMMKKRGPECDCKVFMETLPFAKPSQVRTDALNTLILATSMFLSNEG